MMLTEYRPSVVERVVQCSCKPLNTRPVIPSVGGTAAETLAFGKDRSPPVLTRPVSNHIPNRFAIIGSVDRKGRYHLSQFTHTYNNLHAKR
jgi:hypothetical protein